jgi:uncharacterized protein YcbX
MVTVIAVLFIGFGCGFLIGWGVDKRRPAKQEKPRRAGMRRHRKNRVHTFSRWPSDPHKRLELAQLDVDFVKALSRCGIDVLASPVLNQITIKAGTEAMKAQRELS